jgi:diguanylate cyclase (GGDEF)-like protein/PAS domain S-box-containing protein
MKKKTPSSPTNLKSKNSKPQFLQVLIVEDSEDDALLEIRELKKGGYDPVHERVETATAMKKALQEKQWDIILCNYKMPKFSGEKAIALLKETNIDIPLIIVSGIIGEDVATNCMRLGANDYIIKNNLSRLCPAIARELVEAASRSKWKQTEEALRASEELFRNYLEYAPDGVYMSDMKGTFLYGNRRCEEIIGYRREELIGKNFLELNLLTEKSLNKAAQLLQANMEGKPTGPDEIELISKEGRLIPVEISTSVVQHMDQGIVLAFVRDITERKQMEEKIRQMAYHDYLTGLPNRKLFYDRLGIALAQSQRNQKKVGIVMLDLDNFKGVNDTLGHDVGDLLLKAAVDRLSSALRKGDTVARFGGDEFVLIFPDLKGIEDAILVAQKIVDSFHKPFLIDTHQLVVTTSIGIAVYPNDGIDEDILLRNADIAMYQAKQAGRDRYQLCKKA